MWKAELRLIELSFRSSGKKKAAGKIHIDTRREQRQASIPGLLPQTTEEENKKVDEDMEDQRLTHVEPTPTQPTHILGIQSKQITDGTEISFEEGPFYRTLDIISGIDAGDHIEHSQKVPISPEDVEYVISLETLEKFGYFIVQLSINKELQPHFVHKTFLEKEFQEIKSEKDIANDTINILKKINGNVFSLVILYRKNEGSSSRDENKPKRWIVFRKKHDDVDVPMHAHMVEYFNKRPQISIPGMIYTAGASEENSIML